jgi:hypothetical protein
MANRSRQNSGIWAAALVARSVFLAPLGISSRSTEATSSKRESDTKLESGGKAAEASAATQLPEEFDPLGNPLPNELLGLDFTCTELTSFIQNPVCAMRKHLLFIIGVIAALVAYLINERWISSIDGRTFDWISKVLILALGLQVVLTLLQLLAVRRRLRAVLQNIAMLPMADAWTRLPEEVARVMGKFLDALRPRVSQLRPLVHQWRQVIGHLP